MITAWVGLPCSLLFCCSFPALFWINQVFYTILLYFFYCLLSKSFPITFFSRGFALGPNISTPPSNSTESVLFYCGLLSSFPSLLLSHFSLTPAIFYFAGVINSHTCAIPDPPHPLCERCHGSHDHIHSKPNPQHHYVCFKQLSFKGITERRKKA